MALRIAAVLALAASVAVLANGQSTPGAAGEAPAASAGSADNGDLLAGLLASLGDWVKPADDFVQTATEYGKLMSGAMVSLVTCSGAFSSARDASVSSATKAMRHHARLELERTGPSHGSSARVVLLCSQTFLASPSSVYSEIVGMPKRAEE